MADTETDAVLRVLRIIIAAMMMGIIAFGVVVAALLGAGIVEGDAQLGKILLIALAAVGAAELPAYFAVRMAILGNLRRAGREGKPEDASSGRPAGGFNTLTLIGAALAEGFSLFGLVVVLVSGQWLALAAPLVGLILLARQFPTRDKFDRFVASVTGQLPY
jgi:hypothetical protein